MKKLIYISILGITLASVYASEGVLSVVKKEAQTTKLIINTSATITSTTSSASTSSTSVDIVVVESATSTMSTTSTSSIDVATDTKSEISKIESCDIKVKLNIRKDKINKQIINQLMDKNKLVDSLLDVSSSTTNEDDKALIESKIIELETKVLDMIKSQKEVINIINTTNEISCSNQSKLKKEYDKTLIKIKKINIDIEKKAETVNNLIKNDIRKAVVNIDDQA